jgi:hypothetical protein
LEVHVSALRTVLRRLRAFARSDEPAWARVIRRKAAL